MQHLWHTHVLLYTMLYCGLVGLAIGSFLNVVIYRVPLKLSVVRPRSACPACHTTLRERDNIPLVSWILLRGKCRTCRVAIPVRYPLVELAGGVVFAATAWRIGPHWPLIAFLFGNAALLALACIDAAHRLLPRSIIYTTLVAVGGWLSLSALVTNAWHQWFVSLICSLAWGALFFTIHRIVPHGLGFGDVRLAYLLGVMLGWLGVGSVLLGFFAANLFGAVVGVWLLATKRATIKDAVPYGVFLTLGAYFVFFEGRPVLALFPHVTT